MNDGDDGCTGNFLSVSGTSFEVTGANEGSDGGDEVSSTGGSSGHIIEELNIDLTKTQKEENQLGDHSCSSSRTACLPTKEGFLSSHFLSLFLHSSGLCLVHIPLPPLWLMHQ